MNELFYGNTPCAFRHFVLGKVKEIAFFLGFFQSYHVPNGSPSEKQDIEDGFKYDTNKVECFLFEKGEACEVYATTLHYAPCGVDNAGFMVGVILPRGTNEALTTEHPGVGEDKLLTARNKWLIAHPDAKSEEGHFMGLYGTNWDLNKD